MRISSAATRPPPFFLQQRLRDHALQRLGEHRADLLLPVGGELIDDAVDGRRARCWCAACRRPGGRSRRSRWRWRSSRGRASRRPARCPDLRAGRRAGAALKLLVWRADLALVDQALLVGCTNSTGSSMVMMWSSRLSLIVVDHRRQRGGLAGAGRAGDHAPGPCRSWHRSSTALRQVQLLGGEDLRGDLPEHGADARRCRGRRCSGSAPRPASS